MVMNSLRKLRKNAKLNSVDVAKALGITQGAYSHVERGERRIAEEYIPILAKAFSVSEEEIRYLGVQKQKNDINNSHWITDITIGKHTLLQELAFEFQYNKEYDVSDAVNFPRFVGDIVAEKIKKELQTELKFDIALREFLKERIINLAKVEKVEGAE